MKLYTSHRAPNPRRVRWVMAEKGIENVEFVEIDLLSGQHRTADYRARVGVPMNARRAAPGRDEGHQGKASRRPNPCKRPRAPPRYNARCHRKGRHRALFHCGREPSSRHSRASGHPAIRPPVQQDPGFPPSRE